MNTVTTTQRIDLARLDAELGNPGLRMVGDGDTDESKSVTAPTPVTEADLQAAIDAHVWVDRAANRAAIEKAVRDHLTALRTITGSSGTLTASQLSDAVRALARGQIHLIRLAVELLDGTG